MSAGDSEFDRGHRMGKISQELHEDHERLNELKGSVEKLSKQMTDVARQLATLVQAVARIDQAMLADKETVRQTAAALRDQADAAARLNDGRWTPFNRLLIAMSTLAAIAGVGYAIFH
jgi:uncharacterized protein YoxC